MKMLWHIPFSKRFCGVTEADDTNVSQLNFKVTLFKGPLTHKVNFVPQTGKDHP